MVIVRELLVDDVAGAAALIAAIWRDDPVFFGRVDSISQNRHASALVAIREGTREVVGVGTLGQPSRHPHRMVAVDVEESSRRRGIGSALLAGLREMADGALLMSRLRPWDVASNNFYALRGFELGEKTFSVVLDPTTKDMEAWITTALTEEGGEAQVVDRARDDARTAAAGVLGRWYEAVHSWSPLRPFTTAEARSAFIEGMRDEELVIVSISDRVVGAGLLQEDMLTGDDDLAHVELVAVDPASAIDQLRVLRVVYAELFRRAVTAGKRIRLGVSDAFPASLSVTDTLPVQLTPELHMVVEPAAP